MLNYPLLSKEVPVRAFVGLLAGIVLLGTLIRLGSASSQPSSAPVATSSTAASPSAPTPAKSPSNWDYTSDKNDVTGKTTEWACSDSPDRDAQLCFRRRGGKLESYISFSRGRSQFWCPESCYVLIKADSGQPMRLSSTEAETNSQVIFLHSAPQLLAVVNKAKTVNIEVPIFEEGRDVLHFKVDGIIWK